MANCRVPTTLAYGMLIYILASVAYMCITRCIGTPFRESLSKSQLAIKSGSARVRGAVFFSALAGSAVLVLVWAPFDGCSQCAEEEE